jgi:hypothetical protein
MSATTTNSQQGILGILDQIDAVADRTFAALKQFTNGQRQLMSMFSGMMQVSSNGVQTVAPVSVTALSATTPTTNDDSSVSGVPDAAAILAKKKGESVAVKKGGHRNPDVLAEEESTAAGETTGTDEATETSSGQPSLRSVVWNILNRPENIEKGLRAGGNGESVLKVILDEKLWTSKRNGNMPSLVSQCLYTLKRDGKVIRDPETHCFIAKSGATLE